MTIMRVIRLMLCVAFFAFIGWVFFGDHTHEETSQTCISRAVIENQLEVSIRELQEAAKIERKNGHLEIAGRITDIVDQGNSLLKRKTACEKEKYKIDEGIWSWKEGVITLSNKM